MRRTTRTALGVTVCAALILSAPGAANAVVLNDTDLDFFLKQIQIAEAHAGGGTLLGPGPNQVPDASLPYGLRTVDGRFNNLQPGQESFGAADKVFPRLTTPLFRDAGAFPMVGITSSSYAQKKGGVADPEPRRISNLIVDQTDDNDAATAAAARTAGNLPSGSSTTAGLHYIPNTAPDEGLSAPYNSWFTLFGQFFDHGLDLVTKGQSGTVFIPLDDTDPLVTGPDGVLGDIIGTPPDEGADDLPADRRFMTLTRATNQPGPDGIVGDNVATGIDESADDVQEHTNTTTPFVDQNQTYTSHPAHQAFLREFERRGAVTVSTGDFLDTLFAGEPGLATWAEVKGQANALLGIRLSDQDIFNVPLIATDQYGKITNAGNGYAQLVFPGNVLQAGDPDFGGTGEGRPTAGAVRTGHAFLDDIAHHAVPGTWDDDTNPTTPKVPQVADSAGAGGGPDDTSDDGLPGTYDNELLDKHFITGDGRGNENIGLTAVHHVFHSEHNRLAGHVKRVVLDTAASRNSVAFLNEWLAVPAGAVPAPGADPADYTWNGDRVFQAARFGTEMQYQHLVFEEFARKLMPEVNLFTGYDTSTDSAITAEFAHTVYRFGHSMLTETVDRESATGGDNSLGLIDAFLDPEAFNTDGATVLTPNQAAGQVIRGMTKQVGNELDEFVTDAVRDNLLGLPLDLPALNLARGRDTGIPPLNAARATFYDATQNAALEPYEGWADFGDELRNPESLVNFIAAYGTHSTITSVTTLDAKRTAAEALLASNDPDALEFVEGTGAYASDNGGLDNVDFWVGGLAERAMPFGGILGATFGFVFETQMEALQDGDRFYYLSRNIGLNFLPELEANSFSELVLKNSDIRSAGGHVPHDVFSAPNYIFEMSAILEASGPISDNPATDVDESLLRRTGTGPVRFVGGEHIVMGGTSGVDKMTAGDGDDSLWGDGDNDRLEGGAGNDVSLGGDGDDIITDVFGIDVIKGGAGDDAINAGPGTGDLILPGSGKDFVVAGPDDKETFGDDGDDFIAGGDGTSTVFGDEGSDWIEGGANADLLQGGLGGRELNSDAAGHDVIIGDAGNDDYDAEAGDDVMVTGPGIERNEGVFGFDWVTYERDPQAANADLTLAGIPLPPDLDNIRDRFDLVEGLSGGDLNDVLRGDNRTAADLAAAPGDPATDNNELSAANIGLIEGLATQLGATSFNGGNIIIGGAGSDLIEGRGGDDWIDGDAMLEVSLTHGTEVQPNMAGYASRVFAGTIDPGDIQIKRAIVPGAPAVGEIDNAVFTGPRANYTITTVSPTRVTVTDTVGTDGTDTLSNVELAQFTDTTVQLIALPGQNPVTGTVTIDGLPAIEDGVLTAVQAFTDLDGITPPIVYHWERADTVGGTYTEVGTGTTFTPGDPDVGKFLRVTATFIDGDGAPESVTSAPTAAVTGLNDAPTGTLTIDDTTPLQGSALNVTSTVADVDGLGAFTYSWLRGNNVIAGATASSYTPVAADVNQTLRVRVTYTDQQGFANTVTSAATSGVGANFVGTAANNTFNGTGNADVANGAGGNDTLNMGGGNDLVNGGTGNDLITAGAGDDVIQVDPNGGFDNVNGGGGIDRLEATAANTVIGLSALAGVEEVTAGVHPGVSIALGPNGGAQTVNFGAVTLTGIGFIDAGGGGDNVSGSAGADDLRGGAGNDILNGNAGQDTITGGLGNDTMNGGGVDPNTFVFPTSAVGGGLFGADVINGFDQNPAGGQDLLDVSSFGITPATFAARVNITQQGANVRVRIDGAGLTTQQITLNGELLAQITIDDFRLS